MHQGVVYLKWPSVQQKLNQRTFEKIVITNPDNAHFVCTTCFMGLQLEKKLEQFHASMIRAVTEVFDRL